MKNTSLAANIVKGFHLTIVTPGGTTTNRLQVDEFIVGRANDCHVCIPNDTLNEKHMAVSGRDGQCWIEDLNSAHGTYINGKRLEPSQVTEVRPGDWVTLGYAELKMAIALMEEATPRTSAPTPPPPVAKPAPHLSAVANAPTPAKKDAKLNAHGEAERELHEAHIKAALILQQAEADAERKVEEIYRRAHETQSRLEQLSQKKISEAYIDAENIFKKASEDSQEIMTGAKSRSAEVRQLAETFVSELRQRTEQDCETMLHDAQETSRHMKSVKLAEAEAYIQRKEEEILAQARETVKEREVRMDEEFKQIMIHKRAEFEQEMADRITQFETDHRISLETIRGLRLEIQSLEGQKTSQQGKLDELSSKVKDHTTRMAELNRGYDEAKQNADPLIKKVREMRTELTQLELERDTTQAKVKETQDHLKAIVDRARTTSEQVKVTQEQNDALLVQLRAKLEEEKGKMQTEEKNYFENLKLQTARKVTELEQEMLAELKKKRDLLVRELILKTETFFTENPGAMGAAIAPLADQFGILLGAQSEASKGEDSKTRMVSALGLKRQQRLVAGFVGGFLGAVIALGAEWNWMEYRKDTTPLQTMVNLAQEARQLDLRTRKFNPAQSPEVRDTYMDSVLYTKDFASTYQNEVYQKDLLKALAPYMFKTWRTEEDKIIQLLGMSAALVKNLDEKKNAIHPDFVPQGLEKMKALETEALARMRELLGTQVRLQSFRKFENQFYQNHPAP